jgi:TM2 domain-containing membrane protein YozV
MKCAYHSNNPASARCSSCERNLCPACDHRIKGYPYCQDCIVAGVEILRRNAGAGQRPNMRGEGKSPFIAALLGLIPGLGAAYNGQNIKALVHFVVTVGLWTLTDVFRQPLAAISALSGVGFYFFSIYNAYASAQRHRAGVDLQEEEDRLRQFLRERTGLWGGILIGVGALALLNVLFPYPLQRFWPMLLVAAGIYFLLRGYQRIHEESQTKPPYRTPPPSVIPSGYDRSTSDFAQAEGRYDR